MASGASFVWQKGHISQVWMKLEDEKKPRYKIWSVQTSLTVKMIPKREDFSVFAPSYKCDNAEYDRFISDLQLQTLIYYESKALILSLSNNSHVLI